METAPGKKVKPSCTGGKSLVSWDRAQKMALIPFEGEKEKEKGEKEKDWCVHLTLWVDQWRQEGVVVAPNLAETR